MKKFSNEFRVGVLIVLCIVGLVFITIKTGKFHFKNKGYNIFVVFDDISGLELKAPVMLNGFEVGKVEEIIPVYQNKDDSDSTHIFLKLWINNQAKIRSNARVSIKTLGLMGEKYIQIASYKGKDFIADNSTLYGEGMVDMDQLMREALNISKKIEELISEVKSLTGSINDTVDNNQNAINNIIKNLEYTSKNFEEFSADLKIHPWKLLHKTKDQKPKN